jgi:hypothetical protein
MVPNGEKLMGKCEESSMSIEGPELAGIGPAAKRVGRPLLLLAIVVAWSCDPASADVRHPGYPQNLQGVWAPQAGQCGADGTPSMVIKEKSVVGPKIECAVDYVIERAGPHGPIFSGRGSCAERAQAQKKSTMNLVVEPRNDGTTWIGTTFDNLAQYQLCSKAP